MIKRTIHKAISLNYIPYGSEGYSVNAAKTLSASLVLKFFGNGRTVLKHLFYITDKAQKS